MLVFVISRTGYGYTKGERVPLVSCDIDTAIAELLYIGLYVGHDGFILLMS